MDIAKGEAVEQGLTAFIQKHHHRRLAERSAMPFGTAKNKLTVLRRRRLVESTREVEPHIRTGQVRLTE